MNSPDLSLVFSALADPTRRAILAQLSAGDAPVKDLAAPFDMSGPAITKHLAVLERAGLISRGREGQLRPCRLEPHGLAPVADWIEPFRAMWEERLDRFDAYLKQVAKQVVPASRKKTARPKPHNKPTRQPPGEHHARKK